MQNAHQLLPETCACFPATNSSMIFGTFSRAFVKMSPAESSALSYLRAPPRNGAFVNMESNRAKV